VAFVANQSGTNKAEHAFDALVLVPEANAMYQYRQDGSAAHLVAREEEIHTWPFLGHKLDPSTYMDRETARFSEFIAHAQRIDRVVSITTDPDKLFDVSQEFRERRASQIERAAKELYHRRGLQIRVANFSEYTEQIDAIIPTLNKLVTFNVLDAGTPEETLVVGREHPLSTILVELRKRIEENSFVVSLP
jgi:hypothetical protein